MPIRFEELEKIGDELAKLNQNLGSIIDLLTPQKAVKFNFYVVDEGGIQRKVKEMFLQVTKNLPLTVAPVDKFGNAAKVDGSPAWAVTDESLAELEVAADGLSAVLKPKGPMGAFKVQVKADADLGEGVKEVLGELDVELTAGDAVNVTIAASEPVEQ